MFDSNQPDENEHDLKRRESSPGGEAIEESFPKETGGSRMLEGVSGSNGEEEEVGTECEERHLPAR